ncbi:plasminogen activator inhibitor 1 RNA-binding protein-like isoform X2 [Cimex lectularius]|uniref:Hyaluronan/mRNA-binding protein domain-containing protein n=1 Tax=Cimex lectularius TaxID=79782 RepID=A0A8I6SBD7_CIMLE|nr:plasminogen activator inhibitor 1 RNA-binding protein-like isoform X2 [Cimex lectularius]
MSTTQYGIGVTKNRFELADIFDEDPLEVLKIHEQEREAKKKTKLSEKENKGKEPPAKPKAPAPRGKGIKETQNLKPQEQKGKEEKARGPRLERGPGGGASQSAGPGGDRKFQDNREEVKNRRNREDRPQGDFHREDRPEKTERRDYRNDKNTFYGDLNSENRGRGVRGGRGGFSGRGRAGRGGGSRQSFDARGKREYDRQSGSDKTGVKSVDKRDGSGAHNWGNHRDDLEDLNNPMTQSDEGQQNWSPEKNDPETTTETNGPPVEGEETATLQEEERKELTLDEWKALKAPKQKPTYNLRKAGEGEDPSQWKKMYALQKKKDGDDEEEEEEYVSKMQEYESCEYPQRVGRQKHILDIDIHFKDTRGGVRGRGNRGTGRGGPRMGMRGNNVNPNLPEKHTSSGRENTQKLAPKVDDEHDFPSLG